MTMRKARATIRDTEIRRLKPSCCSMAAMGASNRLIMEEIPAKSTATKNTMIRILLPGMAWNRLGRKMKISSGPP